MAGQSKQVAIAQVLRGRSHNAISATPSNEPILSQRSIEILLACDGGATLSARLLP